ncbi:MAG: hypothetical protein ACRDRI_14755 [Pseudonocardiaceae bacterium]
MQAVGGSFSPRPVPANMSRPSPPRISPARTSTTSAGTPNTVAVGVGYLELLAASILQEVTRRVQQLPAVSHLSDKSEIERFSSEYRQSVYSDSACPDPIVQRLTIGRGSPHSINLLLFCVGLMGKDDAARSSRILESTDPAGRTPTQRSPQPNGVNDAVRYLPIQLPLMALNRDIALLSELQERDRRPRLLVVRDQDAVNLLTACHDFLWSAIQAHIEMSPVDPMPQHLKDIVAELAAGSTSTVAARNLHISDRTISRRMGEILDHLGAKSRFQAGFIAARQWLL